MYADAFIKACSPPFFPSISSFLITQTNKSACSSSLVAVHNAVKDLRTGACTMALAGGVNLLLTSESSEALKRLGLLAPECR